jgi:regulator of protease activity HflC (stomatin/prohibitin superfamily)
MKKILSIALFGALLAMSSCTTADSGEVALIVDQIGNSKGIPNVQMESGFIMYFPPTQDVFTYPTSVQHVEWLKETTSQIDVTSADGASFGLDVALNVRLVRDRAAELFIKYRVPMEDLIKTRIRALVRKELVDNSVNFASDSLLQHRNIYETNVSKTLAIRLEKEGFLLDNLSILKMDLPDSYKRAIEKKIKVIQETATIRSQTEQATQEALRKVAVAKGNFEAAQFDAKTKEIMSQPKMLELYRAETERIWAEKGTSPYGANNVFGTSSGLILNRS